LASPTIWQAFRKSLVSFKQRRRMASLMLFVLVGAVIGAKTAGAGMWALLPKPREGTSLPEIAIVPQNGHYYLSVRNRGATATFHAQIEILEEGAGPPGRSRVFPAYWERGKGPKTEINQGLQDRLCVGSATAGHDGAQMLRVYYTDPTTGVMGSMTDTVSVAKGQPGKITINVTISTVPAMEYGPLVYTYLLTPTKLIEAPQR
jgi:hypothetical protein